MRIQSSSSYRSAKSGFLRKFGRLVQTPLLAWTARGHFHANVNIIYYHGVWPRGDQSLGLFGGMELESFASELQTLMRFFDIVSLDEALAAPPVKTTGRPTLAVTFDDGFDLIASGAADVLKKLKVHATMFVNTASVRYERMMWQHQMSAIRALRGPESLSRAVNQLQQRIGSTITVSGAVTPFSVMRSWPAGEKDAYTAAIWEACEMPSAKETLREWHPYLDWDGLKSWIGEGHGVGFHTHSHPFCSELPAADVGPEIIAPVAELREKLGLGRVPFAYPFGKRLPAVLEDELAKLATFSCLLGTGRFSRKTERPEHIDRISAEEGVDTAVFGRPLSQALSRGFRRFGT